MLKRIWCDPVWSAVIAALIVALPAGVTYVLDWWPLIGGWASQAWAYIRADALFPRWLIGLLILLSCPTVFVVGSLFWLSRKQAVANIPHWTDYQADDFFGLHWRWSYSGQAVMSMTSFCPRCDFQVIPHESSYFSAVPRFAYECDGCGAKLGEFEGDLRFLESKVERSIHQKIRSQAWRSVVQKGSET